MDNPHAERAFEELQGLLQNDDPEHAHAKADGVLCELLDDLGYTKVVNAWRAIQPKWYA